MACECELVELAAQPALSIRLTTAATHLPTVFTKGYADIASYLANRQEPPTAPPFAIYYNMDMQNLDVEFGFPVSRRLQGEGNIAARTTPAGKAVSCLHIGPYTEVESAYNALFQCLKDKGLEASGVAYELYLTDPQHTSPEKLQTRIYLLIKTG